MSGQHLTEWKWPNCPESQIANSCPHSTIARCNAKSAKLQRVENCPSPTPDCNFSIPYPVPLNALIISNIPRKILQTYQKSKRNPVVFLPNWPLLEGTSKEWLHTTTLSPDFETKNDQGRFYLLPANWVELTSQTFPLPKVSISTSLSTGWRGLTSQVAH